MASSTDSIANVGLQADIPSDRKVSGVPNLHDDEAGLANVVKRVRISRQLACDIDPELAIAGELEHRLTAISRVEHPGEFPGFRLDS
jgi:hypothetical protein